MNLCIIIIHMIFMKQCCNHSMVKLFTIYATANVEGVRHTWMLVHKIFGGSPLGAFFDVKCIRDV